MTKPQQTSNELAKALTGNIASTRHYAQEVVSLAASIRRQVEELGIDPWTPAIAQAIRESKSSYQQMIAAFDQLEEVVNGVS